MSSEVEARATQCVELTRLTLFRIVATAGACWLAVQLFPALVVIVVALFFVGTLEPLVGWLGRHRLRRSRAIAVVITVLAVSAVALLLGTVASLSDQARGLVEQLPSLQGRVADFLAHSPLTASLSESLRRPDASESISALAHGVLTASAHVAEFVAYFVSALVLAIYIMVERDRLRGGLYALLPRPLHIRVSRILLDLETIVGGYIRGQALTSVLMTGFMLALLSLTHVPNALALAVVAGLTDVLPYVGGVLALTPAALAAATVSSTTAWIVVGAVLVYQEFESRVLVPRIYARALRLPSSVVFVSLIAGGLLGGVTGALLSLPFAAALRALLLELRVSLPGGSLADDEVRARDERAEREYSERSKGLPVTDAAVIAIEISQNTRHHPPTLEARV